MKFHEMIKHRRFELGLGQKFVANLAEMKPYTYSRIEQGNRLVYLIDAIKIMKALNIPFQELNKVFLYSK